MMKMRIYSRLLAVVIPVSALILLSSWIGFADTNTPPAMGLLGYPVGTVVRVEGIILADSTQPTFSIYNVNGRDLNSPLESSVHLADGLPAVNFKKDGICVFKGTESFPIVTNEINGAAVQCEPPPHAYFEIAEVLSIGTSEGIAKSSSLAVAAEAKTTEAAMKHGLQWLVKEQNADGSWETTLLINPL